MEISVVFPAYNEEAAIRGTITRAMHALRDRFDRFEIVIVDDCGQDATGRIADELAREFPEVRVLHNERNMGSARSVLRAFKNVRYPLVIHNAIDYPLDLCDLDLMTPLLKEADIVVAARDRHTGYTLYRKFLSQVNRTLLHLCFGVRLTDLNFTQIYPKAYLDNIDLISHSTGFVTPELLIRAQDSGFRVKEVRVPYHARESGVATAGKLSVVLESLRDLLRFWWLRRGGKVKPVRVPVRQA